MIEASFEAHRRPGWTLTRFSAVDAAQLAAPPAGVLTPGEKATYLSHRTLIGRLRGRAAPAMVLEDDAIFGPQTCERIDWFFASPGAPAWDVLFADVCVPGLQAMISLARYRNRLAPGAKVALIDLRQFRFAGASAYILSPTSAAKLYDLLPGEAPLNVPIDIQIENLVHQSKLTAFTFFPFLTTLSPLSFASQVRRIGADTQEYVWNLFTRMMWLDRDLAEVAHLRAGLDLSWLTDEQRRLMSDLFSTFEAGA